MTQVPEDKPAGSVLVFGPILSSNLISREVSSAFGKIPFMPYPLLFRINISMKGYINKGLMQYKCMEMEIRKLFMEGFYFQSVMYIANIPAGIPLWQ